jgi:hypothetical protein
MGKLAMKLLQIAAVIAVGLSLSARADTVPFWPNGQLPAPIRRLASCSGNAE